MKSYVKKRIFSFMMLLTILFSSFFSITNSSVVNGAILGSGKYTDVLQDLQTDETFNADDYPIIEDNYSVNVIGISESSDKELFIYTYEPCGDTCNIQASSINISLELHKNINVNNYGLVHISSNGVFGKYLVNNLQVKNDNTRYYEIISIYRKWDASIDTGTGNDNIINEKAYAVGLQYTASTTSKGVVYAVSESEYIELTGLKAGTLRYEETAVSYLAYLDSHYVAFDVAFEIDKLYEADVSYVAQKCTEYYNQYGEKTMTDCDDPVPSKAELNYEQKYEHTDTFLFWERTYSWNRIEKVSDFIAKEDLLQETIDAIKGYQYVLRFAETEYGEQINFTTDMYWGTRITETTILRLKYEVDGVTYNMGVVANKQSDDGLPDNVVKGAEWKLKDGVELILALLLLIILYIILSPILPVIFVALGIVFKVLWKGIKTILIIVVNLVGLPFRLIFGTKRK